MRLVVLPNPVFFSEKSTVTVSPGSIALFVGEQPSTARLAESSTTTGSLFTRTVKVFVALKGGDPLSVTAVLNRFVLRFCAKLGVQVITPFGEIAAPPGADNNEYISVFAGMSESVAVLVTTRVLNAAIVRLPCPGRI